MKNEYILCAAIKFTYPSNEKREEIILSGYRHADIFKNRHDIYNLIHCQYNRVQPFVDFKTVFFKEEEQGFLTSTNRFVDRFEAKDIAMKANQIIKHKSYDHYDKRLYSEDLY